MWEYLVQSITHFFAALLLMVAPWLQAVHLTSGPCDQPLHYSLDEIDPRFQVTREEVEQAAQKAEALWENALQKDVFTYDSSATFAIHFTYDVRQQRTQEEALLEQRRQTLESFDQEISDTAYNQAKKIYEQALAEYQKRVKDYNQEVEIVNKNGGADEDEYAKLQKKQKELKTLYAALEKKRQAVNAEVDRLNLSVTKKKEAIGAFNHSVETFRERYGDAKQFDQGIYDGQGITIYQFADQNQLVLVMAHEMGHALGLDHVDDPQALMYYLMEKQNVLTLGLTDADIKAVTDRCYGNRT